MLTYIIYAVVFLILLFVISITIKAVNRGIEAKKNEKEDSAKNQNIDNETFNLNEENVKKNLANQINQLNKLYSEGILSEDEFKKAKKKILE